MALGKRGVAASKPALRARTALGDIANKACEPQPKEVVKKVILSLPVLYPILQYELVMP